ncbi:hypothetical protein AAFF_G00243040 [Aldrovandia affinis]|uniref:Reverse transcriptase domain-containing protein n=1 Tax=Aldrovandia affinis TaxID=143900 RepID=A0AAD7RE66_9TELE|nr:hypothetical protein AAFF_G00243040 [Aldrovandia affinis]
MMLSIFGDLNFTSLLCYLDDLLVFAPTEEEALGRLRVVFQKSGPDGGGRLHPSVKKLKSFLGMVFFYQSFIPGCSAIAKPLFALTAGMKRKDGPGGGWHVRKLTTADWSPAYNNPLTHILTKPKLDAYEQRWVAKLSSYNFDLKYIPGPRNIVADALSRDPFALFCQQASHSGALQWSNARSRQYGN